VAGSFVVQLSRSSHGLTSLYAVLGAVFGATTGTRISLTSRGAGTSGVATGGELERDTDGGLALANRLFLMRLPCWIAGRRGESAKDLAWGPSNEAICLGVYTHQMENGALWLY